MRDATDLETAKTRSFVPWAGLDTRAKANAERDPAELTPLEAQFQFLHRFGANRGNDSDGSWGLRQAIEFGRLLAIVKQKVGHGSFEGWIRAFAPFSPRTAARYARIAKQWGRKPAERGAVPPGSKYLPDEVRLGRVTQQSAERSFSKTTADEHLGDDARGGGV
jgi:Protein of unknown function (DUF3102)